MVYTQYKIVFLVLEDDKMKKMWNTPDIQELTIQSTTCTGWGNGGTWGNGGWGRPSRPGRPGHGNDNLCRCEGGTSPCSKHHGWGDGFEDDMS